MPRGGYWYGPGFWKREAGWIPGSGGFRGGTYLYNGPGFYPPHWGWGPCRWIYAGFTQLPPWIAEAEAEDEEHILKEEAEAIKVKLKEIENRLTELEKG